MIAILPLLFANGRPLALPDFTAVELEKFITFMVTCSWGHDTVSSIQMPPWWPPDVPFSHPFIRPTVVPKNWQEKLQNVVSKCYDYHQSKFLLIFSEHLSRYSRNQLRYVDNHDQTTSVYEKPDDTLLVTFRNENLYYDAKMILLDDEEEDTQVKAIVDDMIDEDNVISLTAGEPHIKSDIYLCDTCDSHFDNLQVLKVHERLCNNKDIPSSSCTGGLPDFLSALKLLPVGVNTESDKVNVGSETKFKSARSAANIDRGPPYPFSSLAYMKNIKTNVQRDTSYSRERMERYCRTDPLPSKVLVNKSKNQQFPVRYRRPIDHWHRKHTFPNQRNKKILDVTGQLLNLKCRPISVQVDRMSKESMDEYIENLRKEAERKEQLMEKDIVFVDGLDCDHSETEIKYLDPLKRADSECEVIDLCSDEEGPSVNENCDPRAGIACVMRGGAVLRRTAATPQALPSEPCGARERPLPAVLLQPHPVILIAHTLNTLQTISLE